jgi:hypothetical protein
MPIGPPRDDLRRVSHDIRKDRRQCGVSWRHRIYDAGLRERLGADVIRQILDLFAGDFVRFQAGGSNGSLEFMLGDSLYDGCGVGRAGRPSQPDVVKQGPPNSLLEVAVTVGGRTRRLYGFDAGHGLSLASRF